MKTLSLLAVLAAVAAPSSAQMGDSCFMKKAAEVCKADVKSPGFSACMKEHVMDIQAQCQGEQTGQAKAKSGSPCTEDSKKFCAGLLPGSEEFVSCMRSHMDELSPACRAWAKSGPRAHDSGAKTACGADSKKFCAKEAKGGVSVVQCLMRRYDDLSAGCKAELKAPKEAVYDECMTAVQKLCPDADPGGGITKCMMEHQDELPPSCKKRGKKK